MDESIRQASTSEIERLWAERWGLPILTLDRSYGPGDVQGLVMVDGEITGLVTWAVRGTEAEIVTLDAWPGGKGRGARLLEAAEQELVQRGVDRVMLVTTNDNERALRFYLRQGYRLVRVHLDAMDRVRELKPAVPRFGKGGVALRDLWELDKKLG